MKGNRLGSLLALTGAILFSTKAILVKLAYRYDIDSVSLLNLRMLFAIPIFAGITIYSIKKKPESIALMREVKWQLLIYGLLGYYVASLMDLEGLQFIDASLERVIIFVYPTLVVLLSYVFLKKKVNSTQLFAIIATYVGVVIALGGNLMVSQAEYILYGSLLVLGSALAYAIYLVGSGEMAPKLGTRLYNSVAMTIAALAIIAHNAIQNGFNILDFQWEVYAIALLISTMSTVIPSYMIVEGIRLIGANQSSIIGTVGPISTIILASLFLKEEIHLIQWLGSFLVVGSVLILILRKDKISKKKLESIQAS